MAGGTFRSLLNTLRGQQLTKREFGEIGKRMNAIPKQDYFTSAPRPARDKRDARGIYGVEFQNMPSGDPSRPMTVARDLLGAQGVEYVVSPLTLRDAVDELDLSDADIEALMRLGDKKAYVLDTIGSWPGSGVGKRLYPGIWDVMSGERGMVNITGALTDLNMIRKNQNMADAIVRNPILGENRLIPSAEQLSWGDRSHPVTTPSEFMDMTNDEKIGALTLAQLKNAGKSIPLSSTPLPPLGGANSYEDHAVALLADSTLDPNWLSHEYINALLNLKVGGHDSEVRTLLRGAIAPGPSLLKRAAIVDQVINGTRESSDPMMRKGLGFKAGGLTQCSCQDKKP